MEKLQEIPSFLAKTMPEVDHESDATIKALTSLVFDDANLKDFANVIKVDLPCGMVSFLDFEIIPADSVSSDFKDAKMSTMGLKLFNQPICQQTFQVSASITREQIESLKQYGIDVLEQMESVLVNEARQGLWKNVLNQIDEYAEKSYRKTWTDKELKKEKRTKWIHKNLPILEKWFPKWFKGVYHKEILISKDLTTIEACRRILSGILVSTNLVAVNARRGASNVAILNGQLASVLQDLEGFIPLAQDNFNYIKGSGLPYPIGHIAGIKIYVNPMMRWDDLSVTTFKTPKDTEPGMMIPYLGVESISTIAEATMAPKIIIKFRCAPTFIGNKETADRYYNKVYFKLEKNLI